MINKEPPAPAGPVFVEPLDVFWGSAADRATSQLGALPLLGGAAAAASVAVWRFDPLSRTIIPAAGLHDLIRSLPADQAREAGGAVANWNRPRRFAGVPAGRAGLMGIINVNNDSFFPGSRFPISDAAARQAHRLIEEGADILDVGGQSTRPGGRIVSIDQELESTLPAVAGAAALGVPVSIDTLRPLVARMNTRAGAAVINDISGRLPPDQQSPRAWIVGDMVGNPVTMQRWPRTGYGVFDVYRRLERRIAVLENAGYPRSSIAVDPGFGFGKALVHNQAIIQHLPLFLGLGTAIVVGVSRKGSLGYLSGERAVEQRMPASLGAALACLRGGATILRVHDVAATRQAVQVFQSFIDT